MTALLFTKLHDTKMELYGVICGATLLKKLLVLEPTCVSGYEPISYPKTSPNADVFTLNCDKVEVAGTDHVAPVGRIYPFVV